MMLRSMLLAGVVLTLGACSSEPPPPPPKAREEDKALLHAIQAPIEKAKGVEAQVLKAAEEQDKKIDDESGG